MAGSAISAAVSIGGSLISSGASSDAANAQAQSSANSLAIQQQEYNLGIRLVKPPLRNYLLAHSPAASSTRHSLWLWPRICRPTSSPSSRVRGQLIMRPQLVAHHYHQPILKTYLSSMPPMPLSTSNKRLTNGTHKITIQPAYLIVYPNKVPVWILI